MTPFSFPGPQAPATTVVLALGAYAAGLILEDVHFRDFTARGEPVVDEVMYSAIVIMVILTTMATPPALRWSLARAEALPRR